MHSSLCFARPSGLAACLALFILTACASYTQETDDMRSLYVRDSYKAALEKLESSGLKGDNKNRLLYQLEKAMILERMGERAKARTALLEADKIADQLYTTSITRTAASFIISDASTDYSGEDYEKVAIHTQLALSFLADQKLAEARVEARKINAKLEEINNSYGDNKNKYGEDAFARYLAAMVYEERGEIDNAIIDYGRAVELYQGGFAAFVRGGVPRELIQAYWHVLKLRNRQDKLAKLEKDFPKQTAEAKKFWQAEPDAAQIIVIHEYGRIAHKTAQEFVFPFGKQVIRFSYPVIKKSNSRYFASSSVTVEQGNKIVETATAENVADMDEIARQTLEDKRLRMVAKQGARLLAKGQLTEQAYQNFGPLGGIAANVFSAVTETADTRSWTLLPEAYFVSRVRLKPGRYEVKVRTAGKLNEVRSVELKKGQIVILQGAG